VTLEKVFVICLGWFVTLRIQILAHITDNIIYIINISNIIDPKF